MAETGTVGNTLNLLNTTDNMITGILIALFGAALALFAYKKL